MNKQQLTFCIFALGCCLISSTESSPPSNTTRQTNDVTICRKPGFMCHDNCQEIHLCIGGKALIDFLVTRCTQANGLCDVTTGTCSTKVTACYQETQFRCYDVGAFPDPYDCTKYHVCFPGVDNVLTFVTLECDEGYAYSPLTVSCSLKGTDSVCVEGPVERCTRLAQTNALKLNPSIYYICAMDGNVLFPTLRRCKHGHWEPSLFRCQD